MLSALDVSSRCRLRATRQGRQARCLILSRFSARWKMAGHAVTVSSCGVVFEIECLGCSLASSGTLQTPGVTFRPSSCTERVRERCSGYPSNQRAHVHSPTSAWPTVRYCVHKGPSVDNIATTIPLLLELLLSRTHMQKLMTRRSRTNRRPPLL